jgi:hypothetical protein
MRRFILTGVLSVAVLFPSLGTAQVFSRPSTYPAVTAQYAAWQLRGDPVFHAGAFYYPTGPTVFFDGNVMARTGTYEGTPIYEDGTIAPFTVVYVPIGGNVVRPYERPREGELAGTTGSRAPSFPVQPGPAALEYGRAIIGFETAPVDGFVPVIPEDPRPVSSVGAVGSSGSITSVAPSRPVDTASRTVRMDRTPAPTILVMWVPYNGARWESAGSAVAFTPDRFIRIGELGGFPVYRERNGRTDTIFIPSVEDGPVAPYRRAR